MELITKEKNNIDTYRNLTKKDLKKTRTETKLQKKIPKKSKLLINQRIEESSGYRYKIK